MANPGFSRPWRRFSVKMKFLLLIPYLLCAAFWKSGTPWDTVDFTVFTAGYAFLCWLLLA